MSTEMKSRRVALVYPFSNLDSVPSLFNAVELLAEHGYLIDVFTHCDDRHVSPSFGDPRITILPTSPPPHQWEFPGRDMAWKLTRLLALWRRQRQAPYACMIGVDPSGLVMAASMTRWIRVPIAYYSLELLLSYEVSTEQEIALKTLERDLSRRSEFVVIQDEERAEVLARDNELPAERIIRVPNSPLGLASYQRSNYLRQKYNLASNTRIMLHTGSIGVWAGTDQLMRSTNDWPEDWVLVCHTRYRVGQGMGRDHLAGLQYVAKPGRVIFSTDPLPRSEYAALVQSADVGVVYYCPVPGSTYTQDNIRHIGLSSGKLAYCLQNGVPVVVNKIASLQRLVGQYRCGEAVEDLGESRAAIDRILSNYQRYCRNAVECFNQKLIFADAFQQVIRAVDALPVGPAR